MSQLKMGHIFVFWLAVILSLFQNCNEFERSDSDALVQFSGPVPEFLSNRDLNLDNKNFEGGSMWLVGGDDIFYYETNYQATFQSTLVTIEGRFGLAFMVVQADNCRGERQLTESEARSVSTFFRNNIAATVQNTVADPTTLTRGCSFPRMAVDSKTIFQPTGDPSVDFDFYFAESPCTPQNELRVTAVDGYDPEQAKADVESFFNSQIDRICGF